MATEDEMAQMTPNSQRQAAFGNQVLLDSESSLQRSWLDGIMDFFGFGSKTSKTAGAKARTGMLKMKSGSVPGDGTSKMAITTDGLETTDGLKWRIIGDSFGSKIDKAGNFIGGVLATRNLSMSK